MEAWVLNLDAEMEMAQPRGYTPSRRVRAEVERARRALVGLVARGAVVLEAGEPAPQAVTGAVGRAWSPTPSALRRLRDAGAVPEAAPPFDVIRRVNARAFSAGLGQGLPGGALVESVAAFQAVVAAPSASGIWLAKRAFSVAGRGRKKLRAGAVTAEDLRWVRASLREGALQVEPWVEIATELALHGRVAPGGHVELGEPTVQEVDAHGAFVDAHRARPGELSDEVVEALLDEARRVAEALRDAGYFGPFGVDGYLYREGSALRLNPRGEINARYSMAWAIGMGHPA